MKKNLYNSNDESYKHVVNLLKELPKIKAEDNFEYNLKVKIQNKNFGLKSKEKTQFPFWKVLFPASSFVAASLIGILFIMNDTNEIIDNPFEITPKLRTETMSSLLSTVNTEEISDSDVIIKQEKNNFTSSTPLVKKEKAYAELKQPTNRVVFPFKDYNSTDLDEVMTDNNKLPQSNNRATLVGRNNSNLYFDGFYIREEVDKKYVEAMKARLDSLKNELKNENNS